MRMIILFSFFLISSCTWYAEIEHISSIPNGNPFNNREETSVDAVWTGLRAERDGWYIDAAIGVDTSGDFEGRNPYGKFKLGKEIKKWHSPFRVEREKN